MTTKAHNFENGTNGTTVSAANSAGTTGVQDAFSSSSTFPGCTYATAAAFHGTLGLNCAAASGTAAFVDHSGLSSTSVVDHFYYTVPTIAATTAIYQARTASGANQAYGINHNSTGTLSAFDDGGTNRVTSTTLTAGTTYRVELQAFSDATAGTLAMQIYVGDATGTPFYSGSALSLNTRGGAVTNSRLGKIAASTVTGNFPFDDFKTVDGSTTPIGPSVTAPVANAGVDQTTQEPFETTTLDGSGSTFTSPDTAVTYAWSQTSGTSVTLSSSTAQKPTFTNPGAATNATLVFSLTVTGNVSGLADATPDTVSITVLAATEFWLSGSTWKAFQTKPL